MSNLTKFLIPAVSVMAITAANPAFAADLTANESLKKFINGNAQVKENIMYNAPHGPTGRMKGADYDIVDVQLQHLRAKSITIHRPAGPYKVIAMKGVAICPGNGKGTSTTSVTQSVQFDKSQTNTFSATLSSSQKLGVTTSVEVGVEFGLPGAAKGTVKLGVAVNKESTYGQSNTTSKSTTTAIKETSSVTLTGENDGKWAQLMARVHSVKNLPFTAVFEPRYEDNVTFIAQNKGNLCMFEDSRFRGRSVCVGAGKEIARIGGTFSGWNDRVSSYKATHNIWGEFWRDTNFRSDQVLWKGEQASLGGWNDRVSSLRMGGRWKFDLNWGKIHGWFPQNQRQFVVKGTIDVDMTQGTETKLVVTNMSDNEYKTFCGVGGSTMAKRPADSMTHSSKAGNVTVRDVPVSSIKN